jgi:hypothetical protein
MLLKQFSHQVAIYVPTMRDNKAIPPDVREAWKEKAVHALIDLCNGCTEYKCHGSYLDRHGEIQRETVTKIESYYGPAERESDIRAGLVSLAESMARALGQEAVAVEFNGVLEFWNAQREPTAVPVGVAEGETRGAFDSWDS